MILLNRIGQGEPLLICSVQATYFLLGNVDSFLGDIQRTATLSEQELDALSGFEMSPGRRRGPITALIGMGGTYIEPY